MFEIIETVLDIVQIILSAIIVVLLYKKMKEDED